jgi:hypothetical protein
LWSITHTLNQNQGSRSCQRSSQKRESAIQAHLWTALQS